MSEKNLFEQLNQIAKQQPVWDGDLIHKQARTELVVLKWVFRYHDKISNDRAIREGGYVLTDLGRQKWNELRNKYPE